ncbi:MAG: hypothetical protein GKS05_00875 [Nitrospirales bacterium]|nr:hypothetical protein [Nitrospirales bacterium]
MQPIQPTTLKICECGHLHLTYRKMILHFEKSEFLAYAAIINTLATYIHRTTNFHKYRTSVRNRPHVISRESEWSIKGHNPDSKRLKMKDT